MLQPVHGQARLSKAKLGKEEALATRHRAGEARARGLEEARAIVRLERANDHLLGEAKQRLQLERSGSVHEIYMRRYVQLAQEPAASPDSEGLHRRLAVRQDGAQLDEANAAYYQRLREATARVDADIGDDAVAEHRGILAQQAAQARAHPAPIHGPCSNPTCRPRCVVLIMLYSV